MPFYEYECQACKYYMEVMQKISDAPLTRCPSCSKRSLKKLVSVPVFRLKGAGWYETDFKSDKETRRNLVGAEKEESKAESKPESKVESKAEASGSKPADGGAKESKDTRPAEPRTSKAASTASGAGRHRPAPRSSTARRPARASRARSARKKRR